jgi:hypothetical protein
LESSECYPPPLKPDSEANFQALSTQLGDNCSAPILEPERSALLQEALADSQLQAVKAQLERRGLSMNADEAQAVQLVGGEQLVIPFGQDAHLVWTRTNGQTAAVGLIRQGQKTLNVGADGQERVVRFLSAQQAEKLLRKLREKSKFQDFEGKLHQKGKRVGKVRVMLDETNKLAIVGIAAEGDEKKIGHQVRIKVKANKDDEPEDDSEPAIQATACGQATGEAVPTGTRMQPLALPSGGGDFEGGYEGPQICTSQWGYDYLCLSRTPMLSLSLTGTPPTLALPQTFINQQVQASFTIWNGGGGTLTGTVSAPAPFSIVSGASFSLLPGQPQEVVVRFSSGTAGSFSKSIAISSNGGSATVTATGVAHKVSFSPAQVDFGSGLFVLREQCDDTGGCKLRTEKVGLPIEKALTVKNEGSVSVSLTLSTAGPYKIVSVLPTLSPGQSGQVTLRFDPSESGTFTGTVQVGINGGQGSVSSPPLVGVAHKIEIEPPQLGFGLLLLSDDPENNSPTYKEQKLTVKNQGVTTVSLTVSTTEPFSVMSGSSFTLAASETQEVTVRFNAPASGRFEESVRLAAGQLNIQIPAKASVMNEEDFLQLLAELSQIQELDTVIPTNGIADVGLLGFKDVTASELKALLELAKNQDGSSYPYEPDQTGNPIIDNLISYLVSLAIDYFAKQLLGQTGFNIDNVITVLERLANFDPELFVSNYKARMGDNVDFQNFINGIIGIINKFNPNELMALFGTTNVENIVRDIIVKRVVDLYRSADKRTKDNMGTIISWFGQVGVFLLAALDIQDPGNRNGLFGLVTESLRDILTEFATYPWFDKGRQLWQQLARALAILGSRAFSASPSVEKQFQETLMALKIIADMARDGRWEIYAFRMKLVSGESFFYEVIPIDVVAATTLSTGRKVNVFAQFFHAVTGYQGDSLDRLIRYVQYYASNIGLIGRFLELRSVFGLDDDSAWRIARYEPGIVVAVNTADVNDAIAKITDGRSRCGDCFFGVVIEIDPDKEEVIRIIGIGISEDEAKEIAARMGITVGSKWSLEQLIMYLMGMFMK